MKKTLIILLLFLLYGFSFAGNPSGEEILKKADEYRGLKKEFSLYTRVKYYKNDVLKGEAVVKGYVKNDRRTLSKVSEPDSMKGIVILNTDENMWIYIPKTRNPIRITPQQRFMGQTSNGDIARLTYSGDYNAEVVSSLKMENKDCYFLKLTASNPQAPYFKIDYYVERLSYKPVKSVFYAKSGRVMKESLFTEFKTFSNGRIGLSQQIFYDKIKENERTVMEYFNSKEESLPEAYFQKNFMERIK